MKRIMIVGQPGAGKSTLARRLGQITGLPVIHIDLIHWTPGWIERPTAEKTRLCHAVHQQEYWIFEGGHSRTWPERLQRCDTFIWLDLPLWRRSWRVFWRTVRYYGKTRPDLPEDCPERVSWEFYRWIWNTRISGRAAAARCLEQATPDTRCYHLTSNRDVAALLQGLEDRYQVSAAATGGSSRG